MRIEQLQYFESLIQEGSFTKAAEQLFLAEQRLIDDVIAAPLFAAPSLFAVADGVSGVYYDPVTRTVSFADAVCIRE